jgi:NADPH-dependent 2,4-dienoyl-CoA reductase/sulfur reductase-like enzyme
LTRLLVIGGSDGGISASLRARELAPDTEVTVVVGDRYPNFSICGIPYYLSGEVADWRRLAHRGIPELESTGMQLRLDTLARRIEPDERRVLVTDAAGIEESLSYDELVVATGATPVRPPIEGLADLGPGDGLHLLHTMDDTFALAASLERGDGSAVIVGAGYIGLEMADALTLRGAAVTQIEQLSEVLPTVDPELGELIRDALERRGVEVITEAAVTRVSRDAGGLRVDAQTRGGRALSRKADLVLVVVGVRPDMELLRAAGAEVGFREAIVVDSRMRTNLPHVYAAGDCVVTHHRLLGETYLPLGTTAHKQGRVAGENAVGGDREFAGSLGTQVVKVFDLAAARTGLRDQEARTAGLEPLTVGVEVDHHKAYYPGALPLRIRMTGDPPHGAPARRADDRCDRDGGGQADRYRRNRDLPGPHRRPAK